MVSVVWAWESAVRMPAVMPSAASASFSLAWASLMALCARSSEVCMLASWTSPAPEAMAPSVAVRASAVRSSAVSTATSAASAAVLAALAGWACKASWTCVRSSRASATAARAAVRCWA